MARTEAIVLSMTPYERRHPEVLKNTRKETNQIQSSYKKTEITTVDDKPKPKNVPYISSYSKDSNQNNNKKESTIIKNISKEPNEVQSSYKKTEITTVDDKPKPKNTCI